jgi:DNA invertase Pin-like site-specific DNA recombinase
MAIYGYLRVSSDEQDVNNQKQGVLDLAKKNDWEIADWISDEGISGTKDPDKRQLGILMRRCQKGDTIICSELSRLGRKMLMVMSILEYCMKNGIMIYTVKDNYVLGDNIQSTVLAFAFSLAAQIERDMIAMRTKEALVVRRRAGVLLGCPRSPKKVSYVSQDNLNKMIQMAEEGRSLISIAETLGIHRLTVGYHLTKSKVFKGVLDGYRITYANGREIHITKRNATTYGLYYKHIQRAFKEGKDLSIIGITALEPVYRTISYQIKDALKISEHPDVDREMIEKYVLDNFTLPEIQQRMSVDYDILYDYISDDTFLSNEYRLKGQKRCKSLRAKG